MVTYSMKRDTGWRDACIESGDLFAYYTNAGWLVARSDLSKYVPYYYDRWPAIATAAASGPVSSGATPDMPRNSDDKTILYHEYENQIWQIFMGVSHPMIHFWMDYPRGNRQGAIRSDVGNPDLSTSSESTYGWMFSGWESFMGKETVASMFFVPYKLDVAQAIYNLSPQTKTPTVQYHINKIKYIPLDPRDPGEAKLIQDVLKTRVKAIRWSPGVEGFNYRQGFEAVFKVPPVSFESATRLVYTEGGVTKPLGVA